MFTNHVRLTTRAMLLMALVLGGMLAAHLVGGAPLQAAVPPVEDCDTISYDQWLDGEVVRGADKCYSFEGTAGDKIAISMNRLDDDLDPFLQLVGPDGSLLVSDDDGGGDYNSLIVGYELPKSGTYTILAGSYEGLSSGGFELVLTHLLCGGSIAYGNEVFSQVPPRESCIYAFAGHGGEVVGIQLQREGGVLQPHVDVVAPDGSVVVSDDWDTGSLIDDYHLPTDGTYVIVVTAQDGQGTGAFSLTLWRKDACGGERDFDGTTTDHAEISFLTPRCYYTFYNYMSGDISVRMTAQSGNLRPEFQVFGPDDVAVSGIMTDRWSGSGQQGTYTIIALGEEGTAGRFELTISKPSSIRARLVTCGGRTLDSGRTISYEFRKAGLSCKYTFEGTAGDLVTVLMTRADDELDPYLWLYRGNRSSPEVEDDDGAGDYNSLIEQYRLPSSGVYRVVAGSYDDASAGKYYLSFWLTP